MTVNETGLVPRPAYDLAKSILLGLVILVGGIVIGSGVTYMAMSHPTERMRQEPELFAEHMLGQLGEELALSPQQRRVLEPMLENHFRTLHEIRAGVRPQIVSQLEQLNTEIMTVLDERQKDIWQRKVRRLEEHFPTFRGPGRGFGGGQGMGPQGGRGPGQGFGPEGGRGPGMESGPRQEFMPGQQGPQGPRSPMGPGFRRQERLNRPDPNVPRSEAPRVMEF